MEPLLQVRRCAWQMGQCMTGAWMEHHVHTGGDEWQQWAEVRWKRTPRMEMS